MYRKFPMVARGFFLLCSLLFTQTLLGQQESLPEETKEPVTLSILSDVEAIAPGSPFLVGVELDIAPGWKTYWKNPGESGFPLSITWELPDGFQTNELEFPTPNRFVVNDFVVFGYEHHVTLLALLQPPETLLVGENTELTADVRWLVCNDTTCLPGDSTVTLTLPVQKIAKENKQAHATLIEAQTHLPLETKEIFLKESTPQAFLLYIPKELYPPGAKDAEFFPTKSDGINLQRQVTTTPDDENRGTYATIGRQESQEPLSHLEGILVLKTPSEKRTQAFSFSLPLDAKAPQASFTPQEPVPLAFDIAPTFGMLLLFAFLGGIILNAMPCVLPVVSLKVLSFIKLSEEHRSQTILHGSLFSLGVVASFWVLAGLLLLLRAWGHSVGWGFQLQDPTFIAILTLVLFGAALWLFGLFELGLSIATSAGSAVEKAKKESSYLGSFFSGVLATAVATPCSGPFLGTAVGVAVTLPPLEALTIFTALGLGMAAPYLLLALFPSLLRFLPKPGPWMETFKQLMGFLMVLTVLWLLWVFVALTDPNDLFVLMLSLLLLAIAAWLFGRFATFKQTKSVRLGITLFSIFLVLVACYLAIEAPKRGSLALEKLATQLDGWETFDPQRVEELRKEGVPVFVDFTAKWCLLCQSNLLAIEAPSVQKRFKEKGVVKMLADWTRPDPMITKELEKFNRNSVPLYLYYPEGQQPAEVLPQVLTPEILLDYVQ